MAIEVLKRERSAAHGCEVLRLESERCVELGEGVARQLVVGEGLSELDVALGWAYGAAAEAAEHGCPLGFFPLRELRFGEGEDVARIARIDARQELELGACAVRKIPARVELDEQAVECDVGGSSVPDAGCRGDCVVVAAEIAKERREGREEPRLGARFREKAFVGRDQLGSAAFAGEQAQEALCECGVGGRAGERAAIGVGCGCRLPEFFECAASE
jgi:hypothetical protein